MTLDENQNSFFLGSESSTVTGRAYENFETIILNILNSHQAMWVF
jgi:hypothetical protein